MRRFRPSAIIFTVSVEYISDWSGDHRGRPRRAEDDPLVGVFASNASRRPDRLGLTLVDLTDVQGNIATVTGSDAFDGALVYEVNNFDADHDA